ncbi:hypothetical protein Sme01_09980 [Sphaerisporangium melleum]|uniref:Htaa domain protein n=1 Tax=Sphaerisporangium melleum TaxID=321316 RepID=A0A917VDJ2_9ACTN|nr:hypothetical protein [Sphaerisporangium melleum]GGK67018.1 hypothetical protein GCM10007964_07630 [Sphaerisporangium melleum]GII68522.1 hypothetical protein Sme01_09980 [Sphaerisporangium melleum]
MLQRIRAAMVAMALGTGALALVSAPATAAAQAAPTVTSVDVAPNPVVVQDKDGTSVTFGFLTDGATSGGFTLKRPGGSTVDVEAKKVGDVDGKQKWQGTRTFTRSDAAGSWRVTAKATSVVGTGTESKAFTVRQVWETDLADFGASPEPIAKGGRLTLDGRLLINGTGGWKGYKGQKVYIAFRAVGASGYTRVAADRTDWRGRFSAGVAAERDGWWRAEYDGSAVAHKTVSDSDRVDVRARAGSRIAGFDVSPRTADAGDRITARGRLEADSRGWDGVRGKKVDLLFRADGSRSWDVVGHDWTDRGGRFLIGAGAETSGWYRAVFAGTSGVKGSGSRAVHVTVREPADTRVIRYNASPEPVKYGAYLRHTGKLQVWDDDHWASYDHAKVALYFKRAGHSKWEYVKTVTTNSAGAFYAKVKAWHSGNWKVSFRGDAETAASTSKLDYVKVKR